MKLSKKSDYVGIVCELTDVRQHPNADNLKIANALGYSIIVGAESKDGDVGVVFPDGGRLSHEMLFNNRLYRKVPVTGERQGGYFGENGRVKACKLRGQISEAFFTTFESFTWCFEGEVTLKIGDEFDTIGPHKICQKYYTPATLRRMKQAAAGYKKPWYLPKLLAHFHKKYLVNKSSFDPCPSFKKHGSTTKLRQCFSMIPDGLNVIVTSKRHGTSGRTGYVKYDDRSGLAKLLGRPVGYRHVTGSRNVVKNPATFGKVGDGGFYKDSGFRFAAHQMIAPKLNRDEVIYYEILGFSNETTPIMPNHKFKWDDFKNQGFTKDEFNSIVKTYGEQATYHYGNLPGEFSVEVYRIVQGGKDLSHTDMVERCAELSLDTVPYVSTLHSGLDLMDYCALMSASQDAGGQLREGLCLRLETPDGELLKIVKYKSTLFSILEGIKRNDVNYVDMEEIS